MSYSTWKDLTTHQIIGGLGSKLPQQPGWVGDDDDYDEDEDEDDEDNADVYRFALSSVLSSFFHSIEFDVLSCLLARIL